MTPIPLTVLILNILPICTNLSKKLLFLGRFRVENPSFGKHLLHEMTSPRFLIFVQYRLEHFRCLEGTSLFLAPRRVADCSGRSGLLPRLPHVIDCASSSEGLR